MPAWIVPVAIGAAQITAGIIARSKAKKKAAELARNRPKYDVSPHAQEELDQAESEVGGLSSRADSAYQQLSDKQFSASLSGILRGGGDVNNVAELYGAGEEGRLRLALLNDQMRVQRLNRLSRARELNINEGDKGFMYNRDAPWKDAARATAQARKQADEMIWSGVKTAGGGVMQGVAGYSNQGGYDNYFNNTGGEYERQGFEVEGKTIYHDQSTTDYSEFDNPFPEESNIYSREMGMGASTRPGNWPIYRY